MAPENDGFQVRNLLFPGGRIFRFHVKLQGCIYYIYPKPTSGFLSLLNGCTQNPPPKNSPQRSMSGCHHSHQPPPGWGHAFADLFTCLAFAKRWLWKCWKSPKYPNVMFSTPNYALEHSLSNGLVNFGFKFWNLTKTLKCRHLTTRRHCNRSKIWFLGPCTIFALQKGVVPDVFLRMRKGTEKLVNFYPKHIGQMGYCHLSQEWERTTTCLTPHNYQAKRSKNKLEKKFGRN